MVHRNSSKRIPKSRSTANSLSIRPSFSSLKSTTDVSNYPDNTASPNTDYQLLSQVQQLPWSSWVLSIIWCRSWTICNLVSGSNVPQQKLYWSLTRQANKWSSRKFLFTLLIVFVNPRLARLWQVIYWKTSYSHCTILFNSNSSVNTKLFNGQERTELNKIYKNFNKTKGLKSLTPGARMLRC